MVHRFAQTPSGFHHISHLQSETPEEPPAASPVFLLQPEAVAVYELTIEGPISGWVSSPCRGETPPNS